MNPIKFSERMPTEADAPTGFVSVWDSKKRVWFGRKWNDCYDASRDTHWKPQDPAPMSEDEEALEEAFAAYTKNGPIIQAERMCYESGFKAALAHARKEAK